MRKSSLNIAQITPFFYPAVAGIEKATYETSRRLVKKGHRVTVYTSKSNFRDINTLPDEEIIEGIRVKRFSEHFNLSSTWFPKISEDEDILHFRNYCINPHTYLIHKYWKKKPMIVTFHGGFSRLEGDFPLETNIYGMGKFFWQYLFGKPDLKKIDKLIALHEWEKNNLMSKGAPREKIEIIPNGIGDEAFDVYEPVKMDKPYILSLCRIANVKSLDHVIKILPDVKDIYYVIAGKDVGEGELERLKNFAKELNVDDRVIFVGELFGKEKYRYIAGALGVVVPSQWEMLSHTILESMAQGKIVIASDSFGNPYIIDHEKTGLVYKYGDLDKLKEYVYTLSHRDSKLLYLGTRAKEKLWNNYRWDVIVDGIEKIYLALYV